MRNRATLVRLVVALGLTAASVLPASADSHKIGPLAQKKAVLASGFSTVIVRAVDHGSLPMVGNAIQQRGGIPGRQLPIIDAQVAYMPNAALQALSDPRYKAIAPYPYHRIGEAAPSELRLNPEFLRFRRALRLRMAEDGALPKLLSASSEAAR